MKLDSRIHAYDEVGRIAELSLLERLDTSFRFVEPVAARCGTARLSLHARPEAHSPQVSEALPGEALEIIVRRPDGWAWLRTSHDGYLGFARVEGLARQAPAAPQPPLRVTALRGHVYAQPSIKAQKVAEVCLGAELAGGSGEIISEGGRQWLSVESGFVQATLAAPRADPDAAALALRFVDTPYVWGGRSAWGLDCSGLSQLVYAAFGRGLPRDADQQQAALQPVGTARRGDLAFFDGHVGVMLGAEQMVHANAAHMAVSVETLGEGEYGKRLKAGLLGFGRWPVEAGPA